MTLTPRKTEEHSLFRAHIFYTHYLIADTSPLTHSSYSTYSLAISRAHFARILPTLVYTGSYILDYR